MYIQSCTQEQLKDINAEFGVTEDSLKQDAVYIIEWMEKQPHLPNIKDEEFITKLLLKCKTSVERTKQQLDNLYTGQAVIAKSLPQRSVDMKLKLFKDIYLNFGFFIPMSKLTPEAHRIIIFSLRDDIAKIPSSDDILQAVLVFYSAICKLDLHKSVIMIYDLKNMSMAILSTIIVLVPKFLEFVYKTMRIRFYKFYLLNMSTRYEPLLNLFKSIMPPKEVAKIQLWKRKNEELAEVLPKDVLPVEYGGTEKSIKECAVWLEYITSTSLELALSDYHSFPELKRNIAREKFETDEELEVVLSWLLDVAASGYEKALWCEEVETLKDWMSSEEEIIADLEKRPKDSQYNSTVGGAFGIDGTFKKLSVD